MLNSIPHPSSPLPESLPDSPSSPPRLSRLILRHAMTPPVIETLAGACAAVDAASAVIFDNDGTLVDSMPIHRIAWQAACSHHGLTFTDAQFYGLAGLTASTIIKQLKREQNAPHVVVDALIQTKQQHLNTAIHDTLPIAVVSGLLERAQARGVPVAVASGGEMCHVLASMRAAGFDPQAFDAIVTADDVVDGKPHPETFLLAAKRLDVHPAACVGLEDGDNGIVALHAAGMAAVDVRRLDGYPLPDFFR